MSNGACGPDARFVTFPALAARALVQQRPSHAGASARRYLFVAWRTPITRANACPKSDDPCRSDNPREFVEQTCVRFRTRFSAPGPVSLGHRPWSRRRASRKAPPIRKRSAKTPPAPARAQPGAQSVVAAAAGLAAARGAAGAGLAAGGWG